MPLSRLIHPPVSRWLAPVGLLCLGLASTIAILPNQWVQDDLPIIAMNPLIHSSGDWWRHFVTPYWPPPFAPNLYRPGATLFFALQWVVGDGAPVVFRWTSILLYLGTILAVYRLARLLMPPVWAWIGAALFAVHPVHVEVVAAAVNQAEMVVALSMIILCSRYIVHRQQSDPWRPAEISLMAVGYGVAGLFKEHALVLPGLFAVIQLTVLADRRPWRQQLDEARPLLVWMGLVATLLLAARNLVLGGDVRGTFTAEALHGLGFGGRFFTMLGVVPEWFRLMVWPQHLRADYSVQEILPATSLGPNQAFGLLIILGTLALAWLSWRRDPVVTFGIGWFALALFPVSNVLIPTGIVLAERTLFLPSVGAVLALAGGGAAWWRHSASRRRWLAPVGWAVLLLLLGMGVSRSSSRQTVWRNVGAYWHQALIDAPRSYRAQLAYAGFLFRAGQKRQAESHYRRAIDLYPGGWAVYLELADRYRLAGECPRAIELYEVAIVLNPAVEAGRGSLIACLVHIAEYERAAAVAREGVEIGREEESFRRFAEIADSARRVKAAPGTVVLPLPATLRDDLRP